MRELPARWPSGRLIRWAALTEGGYGSRSGGVPSYNTDMPRVYRRIGMLAALALALILAGATVIFAGTYTSLRREAR